MFQVNSPLTGIHSVRAKDAAAAMQKVARQDGLSTRGGVQGLWVANGTWHQSISGSQYTATK